MDGSGLPGQGMQEERLGRAAAPLTPPEPDRGHTAPEEALIRRLTRQRLLARESLDLAMAPIAEDWGFEELAAE